MNVTDDGTLDGAIRDAEGRKCIRKKGDSLDEEHTVRQTYVQRTLATDLRRNSKECNHVQ